MLTVYEYDTAPGDLPELLNTYGLGRIDACVTEGTLRKKINGDHCLKLTVPMDSVAYDLLRCDRLIAFEGQLYRILRQKPRDTRQGRVMQIEAPHVIYDLREYNIVNIETKEDDRYPDGITQQQALSQVLDGSPFTAGTADAGGETLDYLDILQQSPMWAIKEQLLSLWGGELQPDNFTVHIRPQIGTDRRYPIRYRRNIKALNCTIDIEPVITRLHVRGYNNANFEDINDGKDYLDSTHISEYSHVREGYVDFDDVDDPQELLTLGQKELARVEVPEVKYEIDLLDLRGSAFYADYASMEVCELGDTVVLHHPAITDDIVLRCLELERDARTGRNTSVTLGNTTADAVSSLQSAVTTADGMRGMLTTGGQLRAEKIAGKLRHATMESAQIGDLAAAYAQLFEASIGTARIGYAQLDGLTASDAMFTRTTSGKLFCADLMVTDANIDSLNANKITGAVAQLGRLMLLGEDGMLYQVQVDGEGNISALQSQLGAVHLQEHSVGNDQLEDGCITGRTLNVREVFGDEAMIRAIRAINLDVDELFAGNALIGKIDARHLADSTGAGLNISSNSFIQFLATSLAETSDKLDAFQNAVDAYMRYNTQTGVLELGKGGDPYIVQINNNSYAIMKDELPIMIIIQDEMFIPKITAYKRITIGDATTGTYTLSASSTHLSLRCKA